MKLKFLLALSVLFLSCSNDKKSSEAPKQLTIIKSDILLESTINKPFSSPDKNENITLTVSGKTILDGTATFKVISTNGEEVHCETFPARNLIQSDYKTANSSLQEVHIKEVVEGYFVDDTIKNLALLN